jgi:uncharacterized protein (TIGR03435 family)
MRNAVVLLIASGLTFAPFPSLRAQAPSSDTKPLAFEVASVKANRSGAQAGREDFLPGGGFVAVNSPMTILIAFAYGTDRPLLPWQIVGGPSWLASDRFDIEGKAAIDPSADVQRLATQIPARLRTLLEDRFALRAHLETRQQPSYALVKGRPDGRLGSGRPRWIVSRSRTWAATRRQVVRLGQACAE